MNKFLLITLIACLTSCSDNDTPPPIEKYPRVPINLSLSDKIINESCQSFAWDLFEQSYKSELQNILISPLSVSYALAMLQNAAEGKTLEELFTSTKVNGRSIEDINSFYNHLTKGLVKADLGTTVNISNSVWHNKNFALKPNFVDANKENYNTTIDAVDFGNPNTVVRINKWCSEATKGKIPQIVENTSADDFFHIINAIYFKGTWSEIFDKTKTKEGIFTRSNKSTIKAMFMENSIKHSPYYETETYTASSLSFGNGAHEIFFILPNKDVSIANTITKIKTDGISNNQLENVEVQYFIPRFEFSYMLQAKEILQSLGINQLFQPSANLSRMTDANVHASGVLHKTYIKVNEEGAEAAAITNITGDLAPPPLEKKTFRLNRPFLYLIRETSTGTLLFIGYMQDPTINN